MSSAKAKFITTSAAALIAGLGGFGASAQDLKQDDSDTIVVTAQRKEQSLNEVPLSVSAYSQERMDLQSVRSIEDVARLTPGLFITPSNGGSLGRRSSIAIRGISSDVSSATTGIYINDTPIQVRDTGNVSSNAYPYIFDLERVEVLRGPQGTLFGAGAEGGAVRFITPDPSLAEFDIYGRTDVSVTEGGDPSYEAGAAVGGPLVADKLGFRVSGSYRKSGGWVDRVDYDSGDLIEENANTDEVYTLRAALKWQVTPDLSIEPSVFHQNQSSGERDAYYATLSDPDAGVFRKGNVVPESFDDEFTLPTLDITWDAATGLLGDVQIISNTSYLDRTMKQTNDFTEFVSGLLFGSPFAPVDPYAEISNYEDTQEAWTQEIRIQSANPESPVQWVLGGFFGNTEQSSLQANVSPNIADAIAAVYGGATVEDLFGVPLYEDQYIFYTTRSSKDKQKAVFAQVDIEVLEGVTITGGIRQSWTSFSFVRDGNGPVAGGSSVSSGEQDESPFTYKAGLSWQVDEDNMVYASVAKGYRIGGANLPTNSFCDSSLAELGITDAPASYDSDSTNSYEVGSKNTLFGGAVQVAASGFYIKWKDIQSNVPLSGCGGEFVTNFGEATSKGFDLELTLQPTPALTLGAAIGYADATLDETLNGTGTIILGLEGDSVTSGPKWTAAISGNYDFVVAGKDAFIRSDYQYRGPGQVRSPIVFGVDPGLMASEEIHALAFRAGVDLGGVEVSAYVNNALDETPILSQARATNTSPLFYETTLRPRTFGVTATIRR